MEINDLKIGDWTYDVFLTDEGNLGFTVYEAGKKAINENTRCKDIFVDRDMISQLLVCKSSMLVIGKMV